MLMRIQHHFTKALVNPACIVSVTETTYVPDRSTLHSAQIKKPCCIISLTNGEAIYTDGTIAEFQLNYNNEMQCLAEYNATMRGANHGQ